MDNVEETEDHTGMAQCEVTGEWVPEDEIVTIQGRQVSASGKAELLERLKSGEAMPGELERSSVGQRIVSTVIDWIGLAFVGLLVGFAFLGSSLFVDPSQRPKGTVTVMAAVVPIINMAISMAYYTLMHGSRGQTLGKLVGRNKVVNTDGSSIDMRIAFLRILFLYLPALIGIVITSAGMISQVKSLLISGQIINGLGGLYILASAVVALVDSDQQRAIHDRLVNTRVIRI